MLKKLFIKRVCVLNGCVVDVVKTTKKSEHELHEFDE